LINQTPTHIWTCEMIWWIMEIFLHCGFDKSNPYTYLDL
jgi:hypothetical protein